MKNKSFFNLPTAIAVTLLAILLIILSFFTSCDHQDSWRIQQNISIWEKPVSTWHLDIEKWKDTYVLKNDETYDYTIFTTIWFGSHEYEYYGVVDVKASQVDSVKCAEYDKAYKVMQVLKGFGEIDCEKK